MIVQCDNCKAKFNLADDKITEKGLKVRCSKCKTVFLAKKQAAEALPAGPPVAEVPSSSAPPPSPAPKPAGAAEGADPFSDFTFSDDLDLGGKEEAAPAPPVSTERAPSTPAHQDYAPTAVPAPAKPAAAAAPKVQEEAEDKFSFADEDFGSPQPPPPPPPPPPKPAAPKAAPPKPAPPPPVPAKPASAKASTPAGDEAEFGNFNFDEESFAEPKAAPAKPAAPAAPAKAAPVADDEWGNASISEEMPKIPGGKPAAKAGTDEESFGDFHFDTDGNISSAAPEEGGADEVGGFVRSATSRAPVQDEFEASLDSDSESEASAAAKPAASAPVAGSPAKPVIRHAPREFSFKPFIFLGVLVLFLAGLGGGFAYLHISGKFTLKDLTAGNFAKLKEIPEVRDLFIKMGWMEAPDTGTVEVLPQTAEDAFIVKRGDMEILAVKGLVRTTFGKPKSFLQVEVTLYDRDGNIIAQKKSYCDVMFSNEELVTALDQTAIEEFMTQQTGRNLKNVAVKRGETRDFMVVFFPLPPGVSRWDAKVVSYMDADAPDALLPGEPKAK